MSWFWTLLIFICLTFSGNYNNILSEAKKHHKKKSSSAAVVGAVYCDLCFRQNFPKASHCIPGASVELVCNKGTGSTKSFRQQVKTDKNGRFKFDLPFSVRKNVRKIKNCSVKLIKSSQHICSIPAAAESSALHLKSRKKGVQVYSAGFLSFRPLNQPALCYRKPSEKKKSPNFLFEEDLSSPITNPDDPTFSPPLRDPPSDYNNLPALGRYLPPLPQLPRLPLLPDIPLFPPKAGPQNTPQPKDEKVVTNRPMSFPFPPNPFNPIPNPFQPPPSILPPLFLSPPPSIFPPLIPGPPFNLPPVPGLLASPPTPPPPPAFPIPLPPFPFVPAPGFPGLPPASKKSSETKSKSIAP